MRRPGTTLVVLLALGLIGFVLPAFAVGSGCGSASNCQYTDPFGNSTTTKSQTTTHPTTTTSAPSTTPAPPPSTAAATTTTPVPASSPTTTSASAGPTATAATTSGKSSGKTLPYTGYDGWLVAGLGLTLLAAGAGLRRTFRRS